MKTTYTRRHLLYRIGAVATSTLWPGANGQTQSQPQPLPPVGDSGGVMQAPSTGYYPYSGVSGPGFPITAASAHGGWKSGSSGLAYQGEHPPTFPTLPWETPPPAPPSSGACSRPSGPSSKSRSATPSSVSAATATTT